MSSRIISMAAGTRRVIEFNVTYSANWSIALKRSTNVLAADISSARFLLKKQLTEPDASAAIEKTLPSGISQTDGKVTVTLNPADAKAPEGSYPGTLRLSLAD